MDTKSLRALRARPATRYASSAGGALAGARKEGFHGGHRHTPSAPRAIFADRAHGAVHRYGPARPRLRTPLGRSQMAAGARPADGRARALDAARRDLSRPGALARAHPRAPRWARGARSR